MRQDAHSNPNPRIDRANSRNIWHNDLSTSPNNAGAWMMKRSERLEGKLGEMEALRQTLQELPQKLKKPVLVPLCELAFVPGTVERTNEVMVYLGGDIFAKRSAFQATEILARRMNRLQDAVKTAKEEETTKEGAKVDLDEPSFLDECREDLSGEEAVTYEELRAGPISKEEHSSVVEKLRKLEQLEALEGTPMQKVVAGAKDKDKDKDKGNSRDTTHGGSKSGSTGMAAFSGIVQERSFEQPREKVTKPPGKKKASLFRQQLQGSKNTKE